MDNRVFEELWDKAWDHAQPGQSKHAAVLVGPYGYKFWGFNKLKTHPLQQRFAKNSEAVFLHAEIDAVVNYLRECSLEDLDRYDLYVSRVRWEEQIGKKPPLMKWGNSKPCAGCRRAIESFNIRSVYYTLDSPRDQLLVEEWHRD